MPKMIVPPKTPKRIAPDYTRRRPKKSREFTHKPIAIAPEHHGAISHYHTVMSGDPGWALTKETTENQTPFLYTVAKPNRSFRKSVFLVPML